MVCYAKAYVALSLWGSLHASVSFEIGTHKEITQELSTETYTAEDGTELQFNQNSLDEVKWANARTDYFGFASARNHCDNEQLRECSNKVLEDLERATKLLREDPPDGVSIQDFSLCYFAHDLAQPLVFFTHRRMPGMRSEQLSIQHKTSTHTQIGLTSTMR